MFVLSAISLAAMLSTLHADASSLRIPMATHHRDVMGAATRVPQLARFADIGRGYLFWRRDIDDSWLRSPQLYRFASTAPMAGYSRAPQLFRFASPSTTQSFVFANVGGASRRMLDLTSGLHIRH
jgi:hypothetical protein